MSGSNFEISTRVRLADGREGIIVAVHPEAEEYEVKLCGGAGEVEIVPNGEVKEVIL